MCSLLADEKLAPEIKLLTWTQRLRPQSAELAPLCSQRDCFPGQRHVYELVLTYNFTHKEAPPTELPATEAGTAPNMVSKA